MMLIEFLVVAISMNIYTILKKIRVDFYFAKNAIINDIYLFS